jgi:hypothetical protein
MLELWTREQCEQFQMMRFGISCATCERLDEECPWHRQDDPEQLAFVSENRFPMSNESQASSGAMAA